MLGKFLGLFKKPSLPSTKTEGGTLDVNQVMQESQERVEAVQQLQKPVEEQPQEPVGEMQKPQETQEINSSVKRILGIEMDLSELDKEELEVLFSNDTFAGLNRNLGIEGLMQELSLLEGLSEIRIVAPISKNCNDAVTLVKKEGLRLPTLEERKALFVLSKVLRVPYSGKFSAVLYSGWLYLPEELKDIFNEGHWRFRSADDIDVYNGDGSISSSKDNQGYQGYSVLGVRDGEKNLGGKRIKLSKLGDYRDTPFCECCGDCSCSFY